MKKWTGPELNRRHTAFQAVALPTELPVLIENNSILTTSLQKFFSFSDIVSNLLKSDNDISAQKNFYNSKKFCFKLKHIKQ